MMAQEAPMTNFLYTPPLLPLRRRQPNNNRNDLSTSTQQQPPQPPQPQPQPQPQPAAASSTVAVDIFSRFLLLQQSNQPQVNSSRRSRSRNSFHNNSNNHHNNHSNNHNQHHHTTDDHDNEYYYQRLIEQSQLTRSEFEPSVVVVAVSPAQPPQQRSWYEANWNPHTCPLAKVEDLLVRAAAHLYRALWWNSPREAVPAPSPLVPPLPSPPSQQQDIQIIWLQRILNELQLVYQCLVSRTTTSCLAHHQCSNGDDDSSVLVDVFLSHENHHDNADHRAGGRRPSPYDTNGGPRMSLYAALIRTLLEQVHGCRVFSSVGGGGGPSQSQSQPQQLLLWAALTCRLGVVTLTPHYFASPACLRQFGIFSARQWLSDHQNPSLSSLLFTLVVDAFDPQVMENYFGLSSHTPQRRIPTWEITMAVLRCSTDDNDSDDAHHARQVLEAIVTCQTRQAQDRGVLVAVEQLEEQVEPQQRLASDHPTNLTVTQRLARLEQIYGLLSEGAQGTLLDRVARLKEHVLLLGGRPEDWIPRQQQQQQQQQQQEQVNKLYQTALQHGSRPCSQIRVLLCGPFGVGKTNCLRFLKNQPFVATHESTQGIDVTTAGRIDQHSLGTNGCHDPLDFATGLQSFVRAHRAAELLLQQQQQQLCRLQEGENQSATTQSDTCELAEDGDDEAFETAAAGTTVSETVPLKYLNHLGDDDKGSPSTNNDDSPNADLSPKIRCKAPEPIQLISGVSLTVWDFAGQVGYHCMHQMFLRENCVYLLVLNLQTDEMRTKQSARSSYANNGTSTNTTLPQPMQTVDEMLHDAALWLNAIVSSAGPMVGLIVVGTHADSFDSKQAAEQELESLVQTLSSRSSDAELLLGDGNNEARRLVVVDNKTRQWEANELQNAMTELARLLLSGMQDIPLRWLRLREIVHNDMRLENNEYCVPLSLVVEKALEIGFEEHEVKTALMFLDKMGELIFVNEQCLDEWVFPRPQRLLDVLKSILAPSVSGRKPASLYDEQWEKYLNHGVLENEALESLWNECQFDDRQHKPLRNLLAQSGIIMDFGDKVVIPTMLPTATDEKMPFLPREIQPMATIMDLRVDTVCRAHLPPTLFPRLLAGLHQELGCHEEQELKLLSRNHSVLLLDPLKSRSRYLLLEAEPLRHTISMTIRTICVDDSYKKDAAVESCIEIVSLLHKLTKDRFPWVALKSFVGTAAPYHGVMYKWCLLETTKAHGTKKIIMSCPDRCPVNETVHLSDTIVEVKAGCETETETQTSKLPIGLNASLEESRDEIVVFLCHTGANKNFVRNVNTRLNQLGILTFFDEHSIQTGYISNNISRGVVATKIAVIFCSEPFFKKKWPQVELKKFLVRQNLGHELTIVPVVIDMEHKDLEAKSPVISRIKYERANTNDPQRLEKVVERIQKAHRVHIQRHYQRKNQ